MSLVNLNFTQHDRASLRLTIWVMKFFSFVLCFHLLFRHILCETLSPATKAAPKAKWHIQHRKVLLADLSECLSTQVSFVLKQAGHFHNFKFTR